MPQFRRRPGARVNYTRLDSYYYYSTQARRVRGLFKPPSASSGGDADGWTFRFNSNRAPKTYWTVTAEKADGGDPPGEPAGSGPIESAPGSGVLYTRVLGFKNDTSEDYFQPGFPPNRDHNYQGINNYAVVAQPDRFPASYNEGDFIELANGPFKGYRRQVYDIKVGSTSYSRITFWDFRKPWICRASRWINDDQGAFLRADLHDFNGMLEYALNESVQNPEFQDVQLNMAFVNSEGEIYYGGPGGGGGGGGNHGGDYSYTCDCPDYTKQEAAFDNPRFRSQATARNWQSSQAGISWLGPCKHIFAAAARLGDSATLQTAEGPLPRSLGSYGDRYADADRNYWDGFRNNRNRNYGQPAAFRPLSDNWWDLDQLRRADPDPNSEANRWADYNNRQSGGVIGTAEVTDEFTPEDYLLSRFRATDPDDYFGPSLRELNEYVDSGQVYLRGTSAPPPLDPDFF